MYFVLLAAALAILAGVVAVAMGRGGEMVEFAPDRPAALVRLTSASDVAALRLPLGLLGYRQQAADEALRAVANVLAEREAEIAMLRAQLAETGPRPADPRAADPRAGVPRPAGPGPAGRGPAGRGPAGKESAGHGTAGPVAADQGDAEPQPDRQQQAGHRPSPGRPASSDSAASSSVPPA